MLARGCGLWIARRVQKASATGEVRRVAECFRCCRQVLVWWDHYVVAFCCNVQYSMRLSLQPGVSSLFMNKAFCRREPIL